MDTALVIVLIVAALVVLAVVFMASQRRSVRQREQARAQADEHRSDAKLIDGHRELDRIIRGMTRVPDRVRDQLAREEERVVQHVPRGIRGRRLPNEPARLDERCRARRHDAGADGHRSSSR